MFRLWLSLVLSGVFACVFVRTPAAQQIVDSREPFALEIPEINSGLLRSMDVPVPTNITITRLKLWVLNPYATRVSYGGMTAKLNDKSLGPVAKPKSGLQGNFLDIDLRQIPELRLQAGKNVVEIMAKEADTGKTYRCSFVLLPSSGAPSAPTAPPCVSDPTIRSEQTLVPLNPHEPVSDRVAPQLTLLEPRAQLPASAAAFTLRIVGEARDNSGMVAAITVNGQVIATGTEEVKKPKSKKEAPPDPNAGKLVFDQTVTVSPTARAVLVEARDRVGNRTLVTVPIQCPVAPVANRNDFGGRKYAVVVGVSKYRYHEAGLNDLAFAHKDAETVRDWLLTRGGGNFNTDDIVCLTNDVATLGAVEAAINRFLTAAGPNDLVYLFLAGHGAPDPYDPQRLYFLLHDTKVADLPRTALAMSKIGEFLDRQRKQVRLVAFFDTCHSAGVNRQLLKTAPVVPAAPGGARGVGTGTKPPASPGTKPATPGAPAPTGVGTGFNFYETALFRQKGWSVISSSGMNEESQESPRWGQGHGVFTWALLEGAQGKADSNRDCQVSAEELFSYIRATVSAQTSGAQNPQVLPGISGTMALAAVPNCKR